MDNQPFEADACVIYQYADRVEVHYEKNGILIQVNSVPSYEAALDERRKWEIGRASGA